MAFSYACLTLQRVVIPTVLVLGALFRPVGISFVYLLMFFISPFVPVATKHNFKGSVTAYLIILIALSTILLLCHIALQVVIISINIDGNVLGNCSFTEQLFRHVGFVDFRQLNPVAIIEWLAPEVLVFITALSVYFVIKKLTADSVDEELGNGAASAMPPNTENEVEVDTDEVEGTTTQSQSQPQAVTTTEVAVTAANVENVPPSSTKSQISPTNQKEEPNFERLIKISPLFCLATLFFAAALRPSVPGGFYFLIFLLAGSYWATFQTLQRGFAYILRLVMVVLVLHVLCIVAYQTPWMQQHLDEKSLLARLIALEPIVTSTCENDIRVIVYNTHFKTDSYLSPIVLLFSYFAFALTTKNLTKVVPKPETAFGQHIENGSNKFNRQLSLMTQTSRSSKKENWTKTQRLNVSLRRREHRPTNIEPTETTPLVRHASRKENSGRQPTADVDADAPNESDIPLNNMDRRRTEEDVNVSFLDQISYGFISMGGFIYQNSYIFTNILMMAWSIVYHSWLTFVLLLWANVLWMIPNQRKAMMRSSPFIVIYAELLLIAQYIYGMDLTNEELPSKVDITGINLQQIGLDRPQEHGTQPCLPLIVKTSFLLMFWVTLRQFCKEKRENRRSTIADMIAPLHLTIGFEGTDGRKTSKFIKKVGDVIKNLLVRMWIWLLVLVIFLCAIAGQHMTGFRICYMALFLFFLLVFQSSSKAWVKIMYGFWLFLIFYAMSILILIYTYQFDKFDQYWQEYLNISKTLQSDIGLERYKTKDLFLHLVSPTIIVILTVIQVHYFHKRFIESLQTQHLNQERRASLTSITQSSKRKISLSEAKRTPNVQEVMDPVVLQESLRDLIRVFLKKAKIKAIRIVRNFKNVFWRFMELHIIKAVYIAAFVCSVSEVCVLHLAFVALCIIGVMSRHSIQVFISRIISFIVTVIILTKMIYQITYLDHSHYDVNCKDTNDTENNAVWFGLQKASSATGGLMGLLKSYIIYMVMVTLHAVVSLRQFQMRSMSGTQNYPMPKVLFSYITRIDAEKNLEGMTKYLFNYGFYKFGVEISLITLVSTITYRQDIIAVAYVFWLAVMIVIGRPYISKLWGIFQYFIAILIFVQYVVLVGLPPGLCLHYPWVNTPYNESIQRWAMLPGYLHYSHVSKLIFDFILLLVVNRQKRVFAQEARIARNNDIYIGGSNKSVIKDIANLGLVPFENPTRDFLSHIRNYLDIFKNAVLCGFYWITLALVFLAGTNISDFLAIGYLIGSFVFLWQGSDFYLRPIRVVIRRWRWLIYYNVFNIFIKVCLQMAGCLFMDDLNESCCWLVHMLGIVCSSKTVPLSSLDAPFTSDVCPAITTHHFLVWDAICFSFLIFQLRIFRSHYFCHIIIDTKANNILASRGADIIEDLRQKQVQHRHKHEREVLQKIKRKMEKIRATQQKLLKPIDRPTHFDEQGYPEPGSRVHKRKEIKLHPHAVRAGDYYMFEDMDDKFELDLIDDEVDFLEDQEQITESEKKMTRRKTLFDVWKDLQSNADYRRRSYVRQRSYASAPGSRIGIKIDEDFADALAEVGVRTSTHSEPLEIAQRSTSEYFTKDGSEKDKDKVKSKERSSEPSTSQQASMAESAPPKEPPKPQVGSDTQDSDDSEEDFDTNPIVRLLEAFLVTLVVCLNRFSRNYRYVNKILTEEKKLLKESQNITNRLGRTGAAAMFSLMKKNVQKESDENEEEPSSSTRTSNNALNNYDTNIEPITPQSNTNNLTATATTTSPTTFTPQSLEQLQQTQPQDPQDPHVVDIIEESLDTVDAKNVSIITDQINSASLAKTRKSEGLPAIRIKAPSIDRSHQDSGSLSKQRSYERVDSVSAFEFEEEDFASRDHNILVEVLISSWYAILSNTDLICYIVVFINQVVNSSIISLPLPIMVFLWGTLSLPRPTKTFWVTLIAYTQAVVLIKCIFQYKLIWANYINLPNQPLAPAKIFGVELNPNYAHYDLVLLLVLFLHRFILKSQGLWKSEYAEGIISTFSTAKGSQEGSKNNAGAHAELVNERSPNANEGRLAIENLTNAESDQKKAPLSRNSNTNTSNSSPRLSTADESQPQTDSNADADAKTNGSSARQAGGEERHSDSLALLPTRIGELEVPTTESRSDSSDPLTKSMNYKRHKYYSSLYKFFNNLVNKSRLPTDVYALMFLCDFINFFVLLFGFTAFGSQQADTDVGVQTYLSENKVPVPFLIMLLVQFILIVIDRALYLRKALIPKIIFHFFSVIGIHIWMFFIVPLLTERSFYSLAPPIIFYIVKCFYMLLSSYQIKCGFPKRILGNFLTKNFSLFNMISFKVYMQMPFLYELRTILDWVCTDTTMTLFDWLKMEDIFSDIYFIKCSRKMETDFPAIRAQKKALFSKLLMGGTIILIIVISIWGPLCLFALFNAVGQPNVPYEVDVNIRIGPYDPIYHTNNRESIIVFNENNYLDMQNAFLKKKSAITFLSNYNAEDIAAIKLAGNSPTMWGITPPDKDRLLTDLKNKVTLIARFTYSFTRIPPSKDSTGTVGAEITTELGEEFTGREALINMLEGRSFSETVEIPNMIPKFIKVLNSVVTTTPVYAMLPADESNRPLIIKMHAVPGSNDFWWEVRGYCRDAFYNSTLSKLPYSDCGSGIVMYTFNDKKFPSTFSFLTAGGIIGLYTTFVLLASRFLKSFIAGQNRKIMFEDLPYVDRVLQLCLDIYLVREALEFELEEDLFAKLTFLYRSPETMIKWTRPKEELMDDETDTESLRSRRPEHV